MARETLDELKRSRAKYEELADNAERRGSTAESLFLNREAGLIQREIRKRENGFLGLRRLFRRFSR